MIPYLCPTNFSLSLRLSKDPLSQSLRPTTELFEVFAPSPFGRGLGRGPMRLSFAPSPNPSQREGNKPRALSTCSTFLSLSDIFVRY
jgi:hypothetical protein